MAIVKTFVCDVSGVSGGEKSDFVVIKIVSQAPEGGYYPKTRTIERLIHLDVAKRLHLIVQSKHEEEKVAEATFESKLKTLLQDWVSELVEEYQNN